MKRLQLDDNLIKSLYKEGFTTYEVAEKIGTHQSLIHRRLKQMNIETRTNREDGFNENYFDKIDTNKKAYFLGLLYSDGWNMFSKGEIGIELQERDGWILKELLKDLDSNRELKFLPAKKETHQNKLLFKVFSKYMSGKLVELGCSSPKSLTLTFPSEKILSKELHSHFIRGYFDGDGCITFCTQDKHKYPVFSLVGTKEFMESCMKNLMQYCSLPKVKLTHLGNNNTYSFRYGSKNLLKIREYLYKDATVFLERKHEKFYSIK